MKKRSKLSSPLIPLRTGIGVGALGFLVASTNPLLWPLLIPSAIAIHKRVKDNLAAEAESTLSEAESDELAQRWRENHEEDETGITITRKTYSETNLCSFPVTKVNEYILERDK